MIFGNDFMNVGLMRSITILKRWMQKKNDKNNQNGRQLLIFSLKPKNTTFYRLNLADVSVASNKAPKFDMLNMAFV